MGPMNIDDVTFAELMTLEPHGPDTFVGLAPAYPWGRLFGGQVVAQALRAAQLSVDSDHKIHSLHAYFIRGGTHAEPVRFEVDRIRNGRSFLTRRVVARQSNGAILNMSCSFQLPEDEADVQPEGPPSGIARPDEITDRTGWGGLLDRRPALTEFSHTATWLRLLSDDLGGSTSDLAACGFAFLSDSAPTGAVRATHPIQVDRDETRDVFIGASLDHSLYFQKPVDPTSWILIDTACHRLQGGRGLSIGRAFDADGLQVASVVQEVLLRERRTPTGSSALGGKEV